VTWQPEGELGVYRARLPMARDAARMGGAEVGSARTDAAGRFTLGSLPSARLVLVADEPRAGHGELAVDLGEHGASKVVLHLAVPAPPPNLVELAPPPGAAGGAGDGTAGAPVAPAAAGPCPLTVVARDARTRAPILGFRSSCSADTVRVQAPRYAPAEVALPSGAHEVLVELDLAASVAGRLLDERGDPVRGASVSAPGAHASTDARGEFVLRGISPGSVAIRARTREGAEARSDLQLEPGEDRHDLDLRLP
jgi:hypothetical protein